jgi:hypothetical protein
VKAISIASCFCGPPGSANGGYFAGRVGNLFPSSLTVRLLRPPPLETELDVLELDGDTVEVRHGERLVAQGRPGSLEMVTPVPPTYEEAVEASRRSYGFTHHAFPGCFVCGTARERGDGLRIFAGSVAQREIVAAPWVPEPFLDRGDGKVKPEFMTAALDCPGYAAVSRGAVMLLGEITAHIDRCVHIGEPCTIVGWSIAFNGRRHVAGTAVFDHDGELCARARAVWIEPADPQRFTSPGLSGSAG